MSELMLEERSLNHPQLGLCVVLVGRTGVFRDELRLLGFSWRPLSGARERGGDGHRTAGMWLVPLSRVQYSPLLRRGIDLLLLQANGAAQGIPVSQVAAATLELKKLLRQHKEMAA